MQEILTRNLKIFCPQHQSIFEVAESSKIVCEIKEHALSNDFPNSEFWEYCCDCQTFSPSNLEVGGKVKKACPHCERQTNSRFICDSCKTVALDSGEETKGKLFRVDFDTKTIEPSCAGCLKDFSGADLKLHKCDEAQDVFLTSRKSCPFCKKEVAPTPVKTKNPFEQKVSGKTNTQTKSSTAKTRLLGTICPTCGTTTEPDSVFCPNCGQNLKPMPPTPPILPVAIPPPIQTFSVPTAAVATQTKPATTSNAKGCLAALGVLFGSILLCGVLVNIINSNKTATSANSATNYNNNSISGNTNNSYSTSNAANTYPARNKSNAAVNRDTNKASNAGNTNKSSNSSLASSFDKSYSGNIGGKSFSLSLTKSGRNLSGSASTGNGNDDVSGTIEDDGSFNLKGYENGSYFTGIYKGRINSDGSINGTWTNTNGGQGRSFYLSEE